jgi:hypothetical protein
MAKAKRHAPAADPRSEPIACEVAGLARQAAAFIDGIDHETEREASGDASCYKQLGLVQHHATYVRARSPIGALFQLGVIGDYIGRLSDPGPAWPHTPAETEAAIERLVGSVMAFIEDTTGARREDACGDYYHSRHLDHHQIVERLVSKAPLSSIEAMYEDWRSPDIDSDRYMALQDEITELEPTSIRDLAIQLVVETDNGGSCERPEFAARIKRLADREARS